MNKRYFVYAYDAMYGGLHGMYICTFVYGSRSDAIACGRETSLKVINSYQETCENIDAEYYNAIIEEDITYEIWELKDDAPSFEELVKMNLDPVSTIKKYCKMYY